MPKLYDIWPILPHLSKTRQIYDIFTLPVIQNYA